MPHFALNPTSFLNGLNWASPSWDLFIVMFFIATVFLYGMSLGRDRIIVILMSIYMALAVVSNAPIVEKLTSNLTQSNHFTFRVTTFIGIFVLLFFLMSRSALQHTFRELSFGSWWQVLMFSTFHVGLLVSITLSFLPAEAVAQLAPATREVFATDTARSIWMIAPVFGMAVIGSSQPRPRSYNRQ